MKTKKILITGTAGFIGFHLAKRLLEAGNEVVGLDNINDYYDVRLKYARLAATGQLQYIPDKQIADFTFLQAHSGELIFLKEPEKLVGGERVRVIGGVFLGVEEEIYRIKGHKRIVVRLGSCGTVATNYIAKENVIFL